MLNYKKILLETNTETARESSDTNTDLKNQLDREIKQLMDSNNNNDKIDISGNILDDSLSNAIKSLDNATRDNFIGIINNFLSKNPNVDQEVKQSLDKLKTMLQGEASETGTNEAYDKFLGYINTGNFDRLSRLNNGEIENIKKQINSMSKSDAIYLLSKMKPSGIDQTRPNGSLSGHGHSTDIKVYNDIKLAIYNKYYDKNLSSLPDVSNHDVGSGGLLWGNNTHLKDAQLDTILDENNNSGNLQQLAYIYLGTQGWDGKKLQDGSGAFDDDMKLLFNKDEFTRKFNELNDKRIKTNSDKINGLTTVTLDKFDGKNFLIEDNMLKYKDGDTPRDVTVDDMLSSLNLNLNGTDFVNNEERDEALNGMFENFKNAVKNKLEGVEENKSWSTMNDKEKGNKTSESINEINNYLKDERLQFLKIDNNGSPSYNLGKAKEYLQSLLKNDAKRDDFKNLNGGAKKAWIAAVQIALNNLPNNSGKIKVDGIQATETDTAISNFQKGTMKIDNPDKKAGPETIQALINALDGQEKVEKVLNSSGYQNVVSPFGKEENDDKAYGVSDCQFYQKSNEPDILCRSESEIFSLNKDTPRIKKIYEITESTNDNSTLTLTESKVNVCSKGAEKLTKLISNFDNNSTIEVGNNNDNFILKLGGNQQLTLDNDLFTNNDYFGQGNIAERLQIAYVEAKLLADNKTKVEDSDVSTTSQNYNLPNGTKVRDFVAYYNSRHEHNTVGV